MHQALGLNLAFLVNWLDEKMLGEFCDKDPLVLLLTLPRAQGPLFCNFALLLTPAVFISTGVYVLRSIRGKNGECPLSSCGVS